jgi:hypothetical protein
MRGVLNLKILFFVLFFIGILFSIPVEAGQFNQAAPPPAPNTAYPGGWWVSPQTQQVPQNSNQPAPGQSVNPGAGAGTAYPPAAPWWNGQSLQTTAITGTITSFAPPIGVLNTPNGDLYLRLGPWWFWQQSGYALNPGESVTVEGYLVGNYMIPTVIKTSNRTITLRDQYGLPVWRGGFGPGWCGRGRCWGWGAHRWW